MKRSAAEDVVQFLSYSREATHCVDELQAFSPREWKRVLGWLDDAGLALYFLHRVKETNTAEDIPDWVMSGLEKRSASNQQRMREMSCQFNFLNQKFNNAGVQYAAIKGLSLVPQFCPDSFLRYQGDFDYLVDEQSVPIAHQVLIDAGYVAKASPSGMEFIYTMREKAEPSRNADQYSAQSPHAVELHLDIWDDDYDGIKMAQGLFGVDKARIEHSNGFSFPALTDEDAFLLQVLHACHHIFTDWIRISCLFEIGYFLNRRASDATLWNRIELRVGNDLLLQEFIVVVSELTAKLFAPSLPPLVRGWSSRIRRGSRVWIDHYSRQWALSEFPVYQFTLFPNAKLARFLWQQYKDDSPSDETGRRSRGRASRLSRIASSLRGKPTLALNAGWWKRQLLVRRSIFHGLASMRYACEIPRWMWLNRTRMGSATVDA